MFRPITHFFLLWALCFGDPTKALVILALFVMAWRNWYPLYVPPPFPTVWHACQGAFQSNFYLLLVDRNGASEGLSQQNDANDPGGDSKLVGRLG